MRTEPLIIYHNTKPLCRAEKWTFYDKVQSVGGQYISTTIKSPVPITFSIGDYCEYRGERYYMNNLPSVTQQAKPKEYGEGFVYDNVRFDGAGFELCRILMLDITPTTGLYIPKKGTNYTGSSNFQLYCVETRLTVDGIERIYPAVCTLAGKIQANLDRAYPTSGWKILVDTTTTHEVKGNTELRTHTDDKILSFNNTTVANALAEVNNTFKLNFHIKGRTIYIGYTLGAVTGNFMGNSGVVGDNDYYYLGYGRGYADKEHPGRGLYEIKKSSDASQQIITRLRAMGSTKNMPFRYYNKRYGLSQDLYPANLQLPDTFKPPFEKHAGHERRKVINKSVYEVLGETNDAYLDKYNDIKKCKEGLREGVAIWDGSNGLPEIYPTIERMTYGELRGNNCADMLGKTESGGGAKVNGHSSFYYYDNNERVDEILAVGKLIGTTLSDDANLGNGLLQPDTLEESSNIDCPCNVKSSFSISYLQNKVDRGYDLFPPIRMQAAGKYILSPEAPSLRAEVSINTGRHESDGNHASGLCYYEIILSSVSLKDNQKTTIGKYVSEKKAVSSDQPCLIELPKLPDLFDDKKEEGTKYDAQIKAIQLDSVSDVYASIVFHVEDIKRDVQDNVYLTVYAGKPSFGKEASVMIDKLGVYVWSPSTEDKKDINKPFHVIIKDIGITQFVSQFSGGEQPMLSMKDGNCLGRNFLIGKDVKRVTYTKNGNTYNGWQLELTRATDDSIHRYYPNQTDRLQAGDHYVLLGIPMPDAYVQAAEMRLLVAASQYLRDNSRTKYNYEPKVDELFLARNYDRCASRNAKEQSIYWNLYAGLRLPFFGSPNTDNADEELPLVNIPIESLTIKEGDGIIPKVELHLREGNNQSTIQQINAKVDALYDGMNRGNGGMSLSDTNTAIFRTGVKYFLRKDIADTAEQIIIFLKGIIAKAISYFNGIVNNGNFRNNGDITNTGNIITNNLTVTDKATFFELEIQKAKAAGGMTVNSAGTFHVDAVEVTPDGFECYQRAEKDGVKLLQKCEVSDQMMCSNGMNILEGGKGNHFYWRKVTKAPKEVVTHVINGKEEKCLKLVLSKTDHSKNTVDIPQVGDDLVQIGNRDNKERQSVMMSCAYNSFDPELKPSYWAHYMGVNDYDISKHRYTWFAANGSQVTGNFKVQSADGGLESIEDYVKWLAAEKGKDTVVWQVAFSIRHITDKQGETFRLKVVRIVGDKAEEVDHAAIIAAGADLLVFGDNMGTELRVNPSEDYLTAHYPHKRYLMARVVRYDTDITLAQDTIYTDVESGRDGKDAVSYKLIPLAEEAVAYITEDKKKMIYLSLSYNIQKAVGEQVSIVTDLRTEDMTLTAWTNKMETFELEGDEYGLSYSMEYDKMSNDSCVVTLQKGSDIVDQRIVPVTFKPKVVFDIDTVNGEIRSDIINVKGDMNSFKSTINETSNTVGNLEKEYSQLKVKSDEISLTVNNGTRPNLLWGSDLDLSEVQDKIKLSYAQGAIIKQETAKKEDLQRQLDATPTNDTAKRNELQKQINACNNEIATAKNKVNECKAAIQKHLGVGIASTKIDSKEWFEYLKGRGVSGADAIKFKAMKDTAEFAGLFWEMNAGAARNLQLKPNTLYTLSAWVRTEFDKNAQGYGVFAFEAFKKEKEDSVQRVGTLSFKTASSWFEPINEWTRVSTTFTTEELQYGSVAMWMNGTKPATLYICRPKLEEGDTATPWCAYDGTVEGLKRTRIDLKNGIINLDSKNTVVSGDLCVGSLKTVPKVKGDPFIEAHDGVFNIFTFERKKGIELSVDDSGMPHLIFYDKDGNPTYDLGWTGMKQLTDAVVQEYWSADFLMKEESYTDATAVSNITERNCRKFYTYHAAYNRKSGTYGSNGEYNNVTFVEKSLGNQRIADGWYYPVNNGSLARVGDESVYVYKTRKFQYSNGKMIGFANVYIEKDPVTGAWRFSDYKGGGGVHHSDHGQV